ncbi:hypothetical protein EDD86DRAFT_205413 [Gorgonomyces haynaldii]|nr:hypothetical protein EDD86DRAFT_205413 [Gorgonomyces haynaldii]
MGCGERCLMSTSLSMAAGSSLARCRDGYAVSITLKRPKASVQQPIAKQSIDPHSFDRVYGVDPNRTDVFVAVDEEDDVFKCSTREYYQDAKFTRQTTMAASEASPRDR